MAVDEDAEENQRGIEQAEGQLKKGGQAAGPARRFGPNEGPEFGVFFGGKMHVMHLMHETVKAEGQKTKNADEHAIEFVQAAALPQQTVRSLVVADEEPMHEVGRKQDKGDGQ